MRTLLTDYQGMHWEKRLSPVLGENEAEDIAEQDDSEPGWHSATYSSRTRSRLGAPFLFRHLMSVRKFVV